MIFIMGATVIVAMIALLFWLFSKAMDSGEWLSIWTISLFVYIILLLAFGMYASEEKDKQGPCVAYETHMYYNAGAKMMMPAKVCVNRGEWIKP